MDNEMMKTNCIIKSRYVIGKYIQGLGERRKEKESYVTSLSQKRKQRSISPSSFFLYIKLSQLNDADKFEAIYEDDDEQDFMMKMKAFYACMYM